LSKNEKVASRIVLHIDSYDLHGTRFFAENELASLFYFDYLLFLSRLMTVFSPLSDLAEPRYFRHGRGFVHLLTSSKDRFCLDRVVSSVNISRLFGNHNH
jgi:hypothetical protein